jgi:hypothetical protein
MISTWQTDPIFPDVSKPAIYADGSIVATKAISANSLWVTQLYSTSSIVNVTDMSITELSGFKVIGTDFRVDIPSTFDITSEQGIILSGVGLTGSSWGVFNGDIQTHRNLRVDGNSYVSGNNITLNNSYTSGSNFITVDLYTSGSGFIEDSLTVTNGNLIVSGNGFIEDGLTITNGNAYISGGSVIKDNLIVSGAGFIEDGLTITNNNLYVSGIIYEQNKDSTQWNSVYTSVNTTSANWDSVYTSVNTTSGNWDSVYTSVNNTSANWNSVYTSVNTNSANWDSVYTSVNTNSATWEGQFCDKTVYLKQISACGNICTLSGDLTFANIASSVTFTNRVSETISNPVSTGWLIVNIAGKDRAILLYNFD